MNYQARFYKSRMYFFIIVALSFAHLIYYYPKLPEVMASHFDFAGKADSFSSKTSLLIFNTILILFLTGMFSLLSFFIKRANNNIINLPNKEHWLADERAENTKYFIRSFMYWIGCSTLLFITLVTNFTFDASIRGLNELDSLFYLFLIIFISATILQVVFLYKYFNKKVD